MVSRRREPHGPRWLYRVEDEWLSNVECFPHGLDLHRWNEEERKRALYIRWMTAHVELDLLFVAVPIRFPLCLLNSEMSREAHAEYKMVPNYSACVRLWNFKLWDQDLFRKLPSCPTFIIWTTQTSICDQGSEGLFRTLMSLSAESCLAQVFGEEGQTQVAEISSASLVFLSHDYASIWNTNMTCSSFSSVFWHMKLPREGHRWID